MSSVEQKTSGLSGFFKAVEQRITSLVHASVTDMDTRDNHIQYMMSRLMIGSLTLASLPVFLAWFGKPSPIQALAFLWLMMPLVSTFILSITGRTDWTVLISSLALSALTVTLGATFGGFSSPVVIWFAIIPLEALMLASTRTIRISVASAILGLLTLGLLDVTGYVDAAGGTTLAGAMPILILGVIAHISAVGMALSQKLETLKTHLMGKNGFDEAVFQAIGDVITGHDKNGNVMFVSASAKTLLGLPTRKVIGKGLLESIHVMDRPTFLKALSDAQRGFNLVKVELRLHSGFTNTDNAAYGEHPQLLWIEMTAQALSVPHPECATVVTLRDITPHKRHEEELEEATLEAEKANDLKGKFLGTVSHELRTPLNAIIGFSEILANPEMAGMDDARRVDYAQIIHTSGHHLLEIVNTLLDVSRIDTGNFELHHEPFNLEKLMKECCDLIQIRADQTNVTLKRDIGSGLKEIIADKRSIKQVVINLLSNAVKFTSQGGSVTLKVEQNREGICFSVQDTGIGIAPDDLKRVGSPFFQVRSSYDRPYEGTGLGVSVVKGLVGLHNGTFDIHSELGKGTVVSISLPFDCSIKPPKKSLNIEKMTLRNTGDVPPSKEKSEPSQKETYRVEPLPRKATGI
jgi:two-component system, cell cycle sensor histidine kinase DivJ